MSSCGTRLAGLVLLALGLLIVCGLFAQAPILTGGPNPFDSPDGQMELRVLTIGACLCLGFGLKMLRG